MYCAKKTASSLSTSSSSWFSRCSTLCSMPESISINRIVPMARCCVVTTLPLINSVICRLPPPTSITAALSFVIFSNPFLAATPLYVKNLRSELLSVATSSPVFVLIWSTIKSMFFASPTTFPANARYSFALYPCMIPAKSASMAHSSSIRSGPITPE